MRHIHQFTWFELFDQKQCDDICDLMDRQPTDRGQVLSAEPSFRDYLIRDCKLAWVPKDNESEWIYSELDKQINYLNERWLKFNLDGGIEALQYLEYGFGQHYNWHTDSGHDEVATRKLTCVIQLSDPSDYVGGKLQLESQTNTAQGGHVKYAPQRRGTVIVFPSHLMHVAKPVWFGKRRVLVAWFKGKNPLR